MTKTIYLLASANFIILHSAVALNFYLTYNFTVPDVVSYLCPSLLDDWNKLSNFFFHFIYARVRFVGYIHPRIIF